MRLKNYLQELYAANMSKNTWGDQIPEFYGSIYKNPTPKEMKNFMGQIQSNLTRQIRFDLFRWTACHLNKTVAVWAAETEIHERMIDFLKKKGVFPSMSVNHYNHLESYKSDYISGFCVVKDDGKMTITKAQEGYDWGDYNRTVDWKFLEKYFTNAYHLLQFFGEDE